MKLRFLLPVALVAASLFAADAHADPGKVRIGVVDVQRALALTEDGMRAAATLKKLFGPQEEELKARQNQIQSQVQASSSNPEKMQELQKQAGELQAIAADASKKFEKKQRELTDPIYERIMAIVKQLATTDGFDLIVDRSTATYTRTDLDLTDRCIQIYNSGGAAPAPAPPLL